MFCHEVRLAFGGQKRHGSEVEVYVSGVVDAEEGAAFAGNILLPGDDDIVFKGTRNKF